jgi:hypothetical protein
MAFDHEKLMVWQKSMNLVTDIYQVSQNFEEMKSMG